MPGKKKRIEAIRTKDESGLKPCGTGEAQSKPITVFSEFAFVGEAMNRNDPCCFEVKSFRARQITVIRYKIRVVNLDYENRLTLQCFPCAN